MSSGGFSRLEVYRIERVVGENAEVLLHWSDLDEDIAIQDLIAGRGSGESQESFQRWIEARTRAD